MLSNACKKWQHKRCRGTFTHENPDGTAQLMECTCPSPLCHGAATRGSGASPEMAAGDMDTPLPTLEIPNPVPQVPQYIEPPVVASRGSGASPEVVLASQATPETQAVYRFASDAERDQVPPELLEQLLRQGAPPLSGRRSDFEYWNLGPNEPLTGDMRAWVAKFCVTREACSGNEYGSIFWVREGSREDTCEACYAMLVNDFHEQRIMAENRRAGRGPQWRPPSF